VALQIGLHSIDESFAQERTERARSMNADLAGRSAEDYHEGDASLIGEAPACFAGYLK
jgi:hypothetical protein